MKNLFIDVKNVSRVDVMGQPYNIKLVHDFDELLDFSGLSMIKNKDILLLSNYDNFEELKKTLLHELLHAYFFECGLPYYGSDEKLISWLECNYFKILNSFNNVLSQLKKE